MYKKTAGFGCGKLAVAVAVASSWVVTVQAQEEIEEIRVTGSFISRPADRPQPITVMDNSEMQAQQRVSVGELMRDLPQVTNTNWTSNFLNPTNNINLRGLGSRATLVLMNGKRQTIDGTAGNPAVDVNNLAPSIMIERIEILTDGASALYGSDAVAGVANFITRNNFEGFEFNASTQYAEADSTPEWNAGAIFGTQSGNTGIVAGLEFAKRSNPLNSDERYSESRLTQYGLTSSFANPGSFQPTAGGSPIADPLCGSEELGGGLSSGFRTSAPQCQLQLALGRSFIPESERVNGLAVATHEFDFDYVNSLQVEAGFARTRYSTDYGFGVPILFPLPVVPGRNPGVIEANRMDPGFAIQDYGVWSRAASPLEKPIPQRSAQDTFRFAGELTGNFGASGWDWKLAATLSNNDTQTIDSDTIRERYNLALAGYGGGGCGFTPESDPDFANAGVGDCQYWNPFANRFLAEPGDAFYNEESVRQWFAAGRVVEGNARLATLEAVVTGELWDMAGGRTGIALGVQKREQDYSLDYDDISADGGFAFNTQVFSDFGGTRETDAYFVEMVMYPTDTLEVQLAARYEDYNGVNSTDPKVGLLWKPTDNLFLRATAGTSFRQPGENQSFGASGGSVSRIVVGGEIPQAGGIALGDPGLSPETSENWTIGATWDVTEALTVDLTWWSVEFDNLIVGEDANVILSNDIADGFITDPRLPLFPGSPNEVCEVTGRWDGVDVNDRPADCVTGFDIQLFRTSYINQDFQKTQGLDFTVDYDFDLAGAEMGLTVNGTWTPTYDLTSEGQVFDGVGSQNASNFGSPNAEWRTNTSLDWRLGEHYVRATYRYLSELENDNAGQAPETEEDSFAMLDLVYMYTLPFAEGNSTLSVSVVNALDEEDPALDSSLTTNNSGIYDPRGRMWRVGIRHSF